VKRGCKARRLGSDLVWLVSVFTGIAELRCFAARSLPEYAYITLSLKNEQLVDVAEGDWDKCQAKKWRTAQQG